MKPDSYLIKYCLDTKTDERNRQTLEKIKIELDWRLYHYEQHFSAPFEYRSQKTGIAEAARKLKNQLILRFNVKQGVQPAIVSSIYFPNFDRYLSESGFPVKSPVWLPRGKAIDGHIDLFHHANSISRLLQFASFNELTDRKTLLFLQQFEEKLFKHYLSTKPKAIFLFTDQYYFSKAAIDIFRELNRPSFIFSHGLPGIYSKHVDHRADYLLVWGSKIRENYIKAGFSPEKVKVIGHPTYTRKEILPLRHSLTDVLVLPKTMPWHQHTYEPILPDRGAMIVYLQSIQQVLKRLGVKKARIRPHPSARVEWLMNFLDRSFFIPDDTPSLADSLGRSSLVIGPTSTLFLESLYHGVDYAIYEPDRDGKEMMGYPLVPPFDGSDPDVAVASNEEELLHHLKEKTIQQPAVLENYLSPFEPGVLKELLSSSDV